MFLLLAYTATTPYRLYTGASYIILLAMFTLCASSWAASDAATNFDDALLHDSLQHPDWFKISLGDLNEDIDDAVLAGKKGIIVYFGQSRCAYCEQFFEQNLKQADIKAYIQKHYDVIPIDIWGIEEITDTDGKRYSERTLSKKYQTNFTPSLLFYDHKGKPVFRLRGFYPPYKFRAALAYVTEAFYLKESFADYLARAKLGMFFVEDGLIERDFFKKPPYDLAARIKQQKPVAVFFEQGNCHACDLLHSGPMVKDEILNEINMMHAVQLDMWSNIPIITPSGKHTTARNWASDLGIFHTPSILFFDENSKEIMRIDSVVQYYRLWGVLNYINRRGYETTSDYQQWRLQQRRLKN